MPLPLESVGKLIRKAGAHRVSEKATKELTVVLEKRAMEVAREAIQLAKHAGRRTVKSEDIKLAFRRTGPRQPGPEYPHISSPYHPPLSKYPRQPGPEYPHQPGPEYPDDGDEDED